MSDDSDSANQDRREAAAKKSIAYDRDDIKNYSNYLFIHLYSGRLAAHEYKR